MTGEGELEVTVSTLNKRTKKGTKDGIPRDNVPVHILCACDPPCVITAYAITTPCGKHRPCGVCGCAPESYIYMRSTSESEAPDHRTCGTGPNRTVTICHNIANRGVHSWRFEAFRNAVLVAVLLFLDVCVCQLIQSRFAKLMERLRRRRSGVQMP
jgi:hypothetical protein